MFVFAYAEVFTFKNNSHCGEVRKLPSLQDILGVMVGGAIGHALCTGLAVVGGRCIAQRISVRTITIIGGIVFLLFAVSVLFIDSDSNS